MQEKQQEVTLQSHFLCGTSGLNGGVEEANF